MSTVLVVVGLLPVFLVVLWTTWLFTHNRRLRMELELAEARTGGLSASLDTVEQETDALRTERYTFQEELAHLRAEVISLRRALSQTRGEGDRLRAELLEAQVNREQARLVATDLSQADARLRETIDALMRRVEREVDERERLEKELEALRQEYGETRKTLEGLEWAFDDLPDGRPNLRLVDG
ncbi:MAG: hypothetical protein H6739_12150 [Alphaproteobacteria bacterium]|nr:hypothetical protein [Alphaproteobacteria bacterium]